MSARNDFWRKQTQKSYLRKYKNAHRLTMDFESPHRLEINALEYRQPEYENLTDLSIVDAFMVDKTFSQFPKQCARLRKLALSGVVLGLGHEKGATFISEENLRKGFLADLVKFTHLHSLALGKSPHAQSVDTFDTFCRHPGNTCICPTIGAGNPIDDVDGSGWCRIKGSAAAVGRRVPEELIQAADICKLRDTLNLSYLYVWAGRYFRQFSAYATVSDDSDRIVVVDGIGAVSHCGCGLKANYAKGAHGKYCQCAPARCVNGLLVKGDALKGFPRVSFLPESWRFHGMRNNVFVLSGLVGQSLGS